MGRLGNRRNKHGGGGGQELWEEGVLVAPSHVGRQGASEREGRRVEALASMPARWYPPP